MTSALMIVDVQQGMFAVSPPIHRGGQADPHQVAARQDFGLKIKALAHVRSGARKRPQRAAFGSCVRWPDS